VSDFLLFANVLSFFVFYFFEIHIAILHMIRMNSLQTSKNEHKYLKKNKDCCHTLMVNKVGRIRRRPRCGSVRGSTRKTSASSKFFIERRGFCFNGLREICARNCRINCK
jgi:hypothetical protein